MLTEHVRTALSRYLCYRFGQGHDTLLVYLLAPEIEDMIRSSIEHHPQGSFLALEPEVAQEMLAAIRHEINQLPAGARQPIILTTQEIRRFVRKLIELEFFEVAVLSFQELSPDFRVQPIGRIGLHHDNDTSEDDAFDGTFELAPAMP
jgi:type III secretion protein V